MAVAPAVLDGKTAKMGESPAGGHCGDASAIPRLGILQITMGAFHSNAAQMGQRSGHQVTVRWGDDDMALLQLLPRSGDING